MTSGVGRGVLRQPKEALADRGNNVFDLFGPKQFVKASCERADVETPFFLHVVPVGDDFDEGREAVGYNNLDFMLGYHGYWFGEQGDGGPCLAEVPLPDCGIASIRIGQYSVEDSRRVWEGEIHCGRPTTEGT